MGQYYKPVNLDKEQWLYSHEYDNGLKLMEHSWIGNNFVGAVMNLLIPSGDWYKNSLIWAGDYADPELDEDGNPQTYYEGGNEYELNIYSKCEDMEKIRPSKTKIAKKFKYICNHDLKEFVNLDKCPDDQSNWHDEGWKIHPLPLLTCEGNGRGGGDFHNVHPDVGRWSRCVISVEETKPEGFQEIKPMFHE